MAAYRRVYDSHHLQADCIKYRNQLRNPTLGNRVLATVYLVANIKINKRFASSCDAVAGVSIKTIGRQGSSRGRGSR